jgi:hypothetical protein
MNNAAMTHKKVGKQSRFVRLRSCQDLGRGTVEYWNNGMLECCKESIENSMNSGIEGLGN